MSTIEDYSHINVDGVERVLGVNERVREEMRGKVAELEFNIFRVGELTEGNELVTVTCYILAKEHLFQKLSLSLETYLSFARRIQSGYKSVTYHNRTHASDLSQTFYYFARTRGLSQKCALEDHELFALIVAGACHDHEHPGFSNQFLVDTKNPIAIRYNDVSVLENHHIASSFALMLDTGMNILEGMGHNEFKRVRALMIHCVLATDMSKHFGELGKFKARATNSEFDPSKGNDKDMVLSMMFHLADISNATKPWDLCQRWTDLLFVEFFHQGDLERDRGAPISYLMDRTTVNIAKAQINFLDVIVNPAFEAADSVLGLHANLENIKKNKGKWQERFDEYDIKLQQEKAKIA